MVNDGRRWSLIVPALAMLGSLIMLGMAGFSGARVDAGLGLQDAPQPMPVPPVGEIVGKIEGPAAPVPFGGAARFRLQNAGEIAVIAVLPEAETISAGRLIAPSRYQITQVNSGEVMFRLRDLMPGRYRAYLVTPSEHDPAASVPFEVSPAGDAWPPELGGDFIAAAFNIWVNGTRGPGGLERVVDIIAESGAHIVAVQEADAGTMQRLADLLRDRAGWADGAVAPQQGILSRFPIVSRAEGRSGSKGAVVISRPGGGRLRVVNTHLQAYPYGPYELRDGKTLAEVIEIERTTRGAQIEGVLKSLAPADGLATILAGDHNSPSHLDWTPANRGVHGGAVAWPVSVAMTNAGFIDGLRALRPDAATEPLITWTPGYPAYERLSGNEVHDRIDFVYHRDGERVRLRPVAAGVYAPAPWPSDHALVLVSYDAVRTR